MTKPAPLNIVEDRTPRQLAADGDSYSYRPDRREDADEIAHLRARLKELEAELNSERRELEWCRRTLRDIHFKVKRALEE